MNKTSIAFLVLVALIGMAESVSADIVNLGNNAPTANIIDSRTTVTSRFDFTRVRSFASSDNHGRGNVFQTGANTVGGSQFQIDSIVVSKNIPQTFNNSTLDLYVWQGSLTDWTSGDGATNNTAADIYSGTTVTPLAQETSVLDGTFNDSDFLRIELSSPLIVSENSDFGFLLTYSPSAFDEDFIQLHESLDPLGGQTRVQDASNDVRTDRRTTFFVEGTQLTAVPEPNSLIILGLGSLAMLARRRSVVSLNR